MKFSKRILVCLLAVAMLLGCFPSLGATAETTAKSNAGAGLTTAYDALYVQDGLVMLLSAYDQAKAGLVSEGGMYTGWTNKVDGTVATFHNYTDASNSANNIQWKLREGKGIGYDLTAAQHGNGWVTGAVGLKAYLYLGNGIVDVAKDYTVEYASSLLRVSENGAQVDKGGNFHNTASNAEKFGAWGTWVYRLNQEDSLRPTYNPDGLSAANYGNSHTKAWTVSAWANDPSAKTSSNVILVDVAQNTSFRDFYANGVLRSFYDSDNGQYYDRMSIKQNNNQSYSSVITTATEFWLMRNCANTLYAVRVYDRALSQGEITWNTLVDIAAYVGADMSAFASLREQDKRSLGRNLSSVSLSFTSSKSQVEAILADLLDALAISATTAYDALYVQNGLVMLLSAYEQKTAGLVKENGIYTGWTNKVDGTVATFHNYTDASNSANNIWWKLREGKGVGYDLTAAQHGSGWVTAAVGLKAYLYLGNGIVDVAKDYTVEYASSLMRVSENGAQVDNGGNFHNTASNAEKFGAWGTWIYRLNEEDSLRPTYNPDGLSAANYGNSTTKVWTVSAWANDPSVKTSSNVILVDVAQNNSFRDFYANGVLRSFYNSDNGQYYGRMSIKQNNNQSYSSVITTATEFWLMRNCANTLYAVRVYDRALSKSEVAWNTLVDIAAYVGADVSALADLEDQEKQFLGGTLSSVSLSFTSSKSQVEAILTGLPGALASAAYTDHDALYVQSGLTMLLSAYEQKTAGLVSEGGIYTGWTNKVDGTVATFHNYIDSSNSANNVQWKLRTGKGVGYDLTEVQYRNGKNANPNAPGIQAYLYLGNGIVDVAKDYTVEYASSLLRISENGVQVDKGGDYYNISSGTEKFGAWGTWVMKLNNTGDSLRATYTTFSLSEKYGENKTEGWNISVWANDPSVKTSSNVILVDVKADTSFRDFYANGEHFVQMSVKDNVDSAKRNVITTATEFWLMQNCANTLYAVRVYDRALSQGEVAWNTLVDIAAYVGADMAAFADLDDEEKSAIGETLSSQDLSFNTSRSELEWILLDILVSINPQAPMAEGYQISKDGTALRIWASVKTFDDVSKLGMKITFKQNGEVIYSGKGETQTAFLSITAEDTTISASSLRVAGLYAASVTGFAEGIYTVEVTPYLILMDGTVVTGVTRAVEILF